MAYLAAISPPTTVYGEHRYIHYAHTLGLQTDLVRVIVVSWDCGEPPVFVTRQGDAVRSHLEWVNAQPGDVAVIRIYAHHNHSLQGRPELVGDITQDGGPGQPFERGGGGDGIAPVEFTQASPSSLWTIAHNLGRWPMVQLRTLSGVVFDADIQHLSSNVLQVNLSTPLAGIARLA